MDDYDIIIMDEEDDARNAVRDRRTQQWVRRGPAIIRRPTRVVRTPSRVVGGQTVVVDDGRAVAAPSRTVLGGLTVGELLESATQVLAAIQSLPAPPVATGEGGTDVSNLILYQTALAQHAKRDEQIRTLGSIVGKLID